MYPVRHLKEDRDVVPVSLRSLLTDNTPSPRKVGTSPRSTSPTLFEQWCGFFNVPQESEQ